MSGDGVAGLTQAQLVEQAVQKMTPEQAQKALAELEELEKELETQHEMAVSADPFWFYEPSDGTISDERRAFLAKYLRPEDIPLKLAGQTNVHCSLASIRGASGGNQSGKTTVGAIEAFIKATGEIPFALRDIYPKQRLPKRQPQHVRVVGEDYENGILLNLIPTYKYWVPREYLIDGKWERSYSSEKGMLTLVKKGQVTGTIEFMSNKQDVGSFQGPPRHMIIYDEEPKSSIYKENLLRFTTADSLDILFCMTPTRGLSWVHDDIFGKEDDGGGNLIEWFQIASVCNKKANMKVLDEIMRGPLSYDEKKMRLLGEFVSLTGLVYKGLYDKSVHLIPPFEITKEFSGHSGLDPHLVKDTAMVFMAVDRDDNVYIVRCKQKYADTDEVKADWHAMVAELGLRMTWSAMDKSADSDAKAFHDRNIYRELTTGKNAIPAVRKSVKAEGSIKAGVDIIKQYLKNAITKEGPGMYIVDCPENKPLINAIRTLERDAHANEDDKGIRDKIKEGKHDLHAALRYMFQHRIKWVPPVEHVPEYEPADADTGY